MKTVKLSAIILIYVFLSAIPVFSCDDTLIMLLTSKDPTSEFSKTIRSFNTDLTLLGSSMKAAEKINYDAELNKVMDSWLEFSKRYMTNPPKEAKNDLKWIEKMSATSKKIGAIRKLIVANKFYEAHNKVLELSSSIGKFFEGFGISDEKQLFVVTSSNLINLERALLENNKNAAASMTIEIYKNLEQFIPMLNNPKKGLNKEILTLLDSFSNEIKQDKNLKRLDPQIQEIKIKFEEMRSEILLKEWFPNINIEAGDK